MTESIALGSVRAELNAGMTTLTRGFAAIADGPKGLNLVLRLIDPDGSKHSSRYYRRIRQTTFDLQDSHQPSDKNHWNINAKSPVVGSIYTIMAEPCIAQLDQPPSRHDVGTPVWERVWRHVPESSKDDAALARERNGPRWACMVSAMRKTFGELKGLRTVELGSGRADLSVLLAEQGAHVTLVDQSDMALDLARQRFDRLGLPAEYRKGDILAPANLCQNGFDVSLSYGVIEHFRNTDRTRTIQTHHDVIRPGGMAIIGVPNLWCPQYRAWKAYLELRGWWPYGMEIPYSRRELMSRAAQAGFVDCKVPCTGFWQAIGDQWGRSIIGRGPDWSRKKSMLDPWFGFSLLLLGWRPSKASTQ